MREDDGPCRNGFRRGGGLKRKPDDRCEYSFGLGFFPSQRGLVMRRHPISMFLQELCANFFVVEVIWVWDDGGVIVRPPGDERLGYIERRGVPVAKETCLAESHCY